MTVNLIPNNWFVERDTPDELRLVNKLSNKIRKIEKTA
ncbi:DUF6906 family protein [Chengkuizengella marina]